MKPEIQANQRQFNNKRHVFSISREIYNFLLSNDQKDYVFTVLLVHNA